MNEPVMSVFHALRLWDNSFKLRDLGEVSDCADTPQRATARSLLRLYKHGHVRMSRADADALAQMLKTRRK